MKKKITSSKLFKKLKEKKYRDLFVAGEVRRLIPFQLRALRSAREWTQGEVGERAKMPQTVISRIENGNAASLSVKTLLKLAAAFDVALVIRFEPIDRLINWVDGLSPERMAPRSSTEIIAEVERLNEPRAALAQRVTRTLSAVPSQPVATSGVQQTLTFSTPTRVTETGTEATSNQPFDVTETTADVYQRATA